jgi:hypothetical protein
VIYSLAGGTNPPLYQKEQLMPIDTSVKLVCRDCGNDMTESEVKDYLTLYLFEPQEVDGVKEGICPKCLQDRDDCGDDHEEVMAEFSG